MESDPRRALRIFLADDDEDDRYFFREALKQVTNDITHLTEVDGVLLMPELHSALLLPQFIFLDLNMPYKNGKECLIELRSLEKFRDIPVIIFSTSCHYSDVEETYNSGANLFIQKPSGFSPMIDLLKKVFRLNWNEYIPKPERNKFILKG